MLDDLNAPAPTLDADLTPRPLPSRDEIRRDVIVARRWLALVAADAGDARQARAQDLLAVDPATGRDHLEEVAVRALRIAARTCGTEGEEVQRLARDMVELIYEFSEDAGDRPSPLYFLEPTALLEVLETAVVYIAWDADVRQGPASGCPNTRHLARLARVDEDVIERQLERDGISFQPLGVSRGEMAEMTVGDQLYWCSQRFEFGIDDIPGWLAQFPGFTPTVAISDKDAAGR